MPAVAEAKEAKAQKTCLITLVVPGSSDRVIKVFPAEHEKEKVWLDNANGIRRWEAIERTMNNYAQRGTAIPKPAPWHSSSKDLKTIELKEEDIPTVFLDGVVLEAPPIEERAPKRNHPVTTSELDEKVSKLESSIAGLTELMGKIVSKLGNEPPQAASDPKPKFACSKCGKEFSDHGLKIHQAKCK